MKIAVLKERTPEELRVALSADTAKKLVDMGHDILVEAGAGEASGISDDTLKTAGVKIEKDVIRLLEAADIVLKVQPPFETLEDGLMEAEHMKKGAVYAGHLNVFDNRNKLEKFIGNQVTAFSMELIPRITRAQGMDVLSSQSNLAGYKAVIDAVAASRKVIPMMMTAAGTVNPSKVLIMGAGVAGLQAIATAKRLGAVVSAFDVRPAVKEQVESLGGKFIEVPSAETKEAETSGGYAKEMSEEYKRKQQEMIEEIIPTQDIVITTALIPGKPAPLLIPKHIVQKMRPGSVIVDLAVSAGGNCELSEAGKVVSKHGVTIIGYNNMPSRVAYDASQLYAKNLFNFLTLLLDKETGKLFINKEDQIIAGTMVVDQGKVVHPLVLEKPLKEATKKTPATQQPPKKAIEQNPRMKKPAGGSKRPAPRKAGGKIKETRK